MKRIIFTTILIFTIHFAVYSQTENEFSECPKIFSVNYNFLRERGKPFVIEISVINGKKPDLKYFWKVDKGEIISGQGTSKIKVSTKEYDSLLKTSLKIKGLPASCQSEISEEIVIPHKGDQPIIFDSYGKISQKDELNKFEEFYKELLKEENDSGLILLKTDTAEDLLARLKKLNDLLTVNKYDKSRLIVTITDDENTQSKMWFVSDEMPDCDNCEKINLATYIQDVQNLIEKGYIFEETKDSEDN
jgi:hypothetical protein